MSRSWSGTARASRVPPRPRSLPAEACRLCRWRCYLGLLIAPGGASRPGRDAHGQGSAVVNDGDTITLGRSASACAASMRPNMRRSASKEGEDYPCGRDGAPGAGTLDRQADRFLRGAGSATATAGCSAVATTAADLNRARSRPAGRLPMAISKPRWPLPDQARQASGPALSTSRTIGARATITKWSKESTVVWLRSGRWLARFFRFW